MTKPAIRVALLAALILICLATLPIHAFETVHPLTGRKIAGVCGVGGASWLERPEREEEEHSDAAVEALGLKPGMMVADVGAGTGYMSIKMARKIGPTGKVFANDIQPEMLKLLQKNAQQAKVTNIEPVLGTAAGTNLPRGQMDLVLLVDVYHEFSEPEKMLRDLRETLKPDGRLVLIEYRGEDPTVPIRPEHKMTVAQVKTELEAEGFVLGPVIETLPRQHILFLTKTAGKAKSAAQ
jgi:2-polyprenyl-3-methyl-5-hydroxy-6-metoxy-1,4-benzoquinol methylase